MYSKMLKFKAFALSLVLVLTLFSCSDDGDDPDTFLEKNGGTVWTISQSGASVFAKINNSVSNPLEIWGSLGDELCYIYQSIKDEGAEVEVLENTESTFKVRVDESSTEYTILTLTVAGNLLTIQYDYYEDGEIDESEIIPLQKTADTTDDLEICELK